MAPKKKASQPAAIADDPADAAPIAIATDGGNATLLNRVQVAVEAICGHAVFKNIRRANPLGTSSGGPGAAFNLEEFREAMAGPARKYECQINLMWIDMTFLAMHGVPIRAQAVDDLINNNRQAVPHFSSVEVGIEDPKSYDPSQHKGALKRVSPPEEMFALLLKMQADLATSTNDYLKQCKRALLDVRCKFVHLETREDMWWYEYNLREHAGQTFRAVYQTAYQRICGVSRVIADVAQKHGRESATEARVIKIYQEKAESVEWAADAKDKDKHTDTFIREAFAVCKSMFCMQEVENAIKTLDAAMGHANPLDSVHKLGTIRRVARTPNMIQWVTLALVDNILDGGVEGLQHLSLQDMKPGKGRCIVGCYVLKKQLLDHLLSHAGRMFSFSVVAPLRQMCSSHREFRNTYGSAKQPLADLRFMADWPNSARFFIDAVAKMVFSHVFPYSQGFQAVAKANGTAERVLTFGPFAEAWERITRAHEREKDELAAKAASIVGCVPS